MSEETVRSVRVTSTWWHSHRAYDAVELIADAVVHGVGIVLALFGGSALLLYAGVISAPEYILPISIYVVSLLCVLVISLLFNQCPPNQYKRHLARLDQAAIFLFIAGTYTPLLCALDPRSAAKMMLYFVWAVALSGMALKLFVPHRFGRIAIFLYLALGWSAILVLPDLSTGMSSTALNLLVIGGGVYTVGIAFHLWDTLRFHNAIWHLAVVSGALLHFAAVVDCMILSRG